MTEQELYDFGDALRVNPRSWSQFSPQEQSLVEVMLTPNPYFSGWQKTQVRQWKLLAPDQESIDQANSLLAVSGRPHRVAPRTATNGDLLLESDLLSDREGNYAPIQSFLESLTLVSRAETDFPQPEPEE